MKTDFHYLSAEEALRTVDSSAEGLTTNEAKKRLLKNGANILGQEKPYSRFKVFLSQFQNPLIYILIFATIFSVLAGEHTDAWVIVAAILVNVIIGYIQEDKANNALNKLKSMVEHHALVIRGNQKIEILAADLVVGDILVLRPGSFVLADARLFESNDLETNEASLSGESAAILKKIDIIDKEAALADRKNMVYAGTSIVSGNGLAVVIATGRETEIGKISEMVKNTTDEKTPLQERLIGISKFLGITALFACLVVVGAGLLNDFDFLDIFISATAIAVAAIPEGMAVAVTVILALGMKETVKKKALTRKLLAAETLGSIDVICSDKTGTLTEGVMRLEKIITSLANYDLADLISGKNLNKLDDFLTSLHIGVLCNNAVLKNKEDKGVGSALEIAFLKAALEFSAKNDSSRESSTRIAELPFSSEKKYMLSLHEENKKYILYGKGAGEIIIDKCSNIQENGVIRKIEKTDLEKIKAEYDKLTESGLRVIALAFKNLKDKPINNKSDKVDWNKLDNGLTFVSLAAFKDPLRPDSKQTISLCRQAGIRPIIITGDHPGTAYAIAAELKISFNRSEVVTGPDLDKMDDKKLQAVVKKFSIYARVSPEHKIRIVKALKHNGKVVAMTGDGLNDSPALKAADIGICLGSGTEVAKETADIVLLDDNFSVIVDAIKQGRIIFDNIRKSITYLLSDSFSEMVLILGSIIFHTPLALLPTQILWINILNDGLPNFSLAFEKGDNSVMKRPPLKREEPIFNKEMKAIVLGWGIARDVLLFGLFFYLSKRLEILGWSVEYLRTIFFAMLIFKSITSIFSIRNLHLPIYKIPQFHNRYLFASVAIGLLLMIGAVYLPFLNEILKTAPLELSAWIIIIAVAILNLIITELIKAYFIRQENSRK